MSFARKINKISNSILRMINEQEEDYYYITPQELLDILELASYSSAVLKPKNFDGKNLYVQGKLDLGGLPIKSLGNIGYVDGDLNIQHTKISDLGITKVRGTIWDFGSPIQKMRERREELKKEAEADERRQDGDWDLDNPNIDEEGLAANALFLNLVYDGTLNEMDEDTKNEVKTLKDRYDEYQERYDEIRNTASQDELDELAQETIDILNEIEELKSDTADVYYILPAKYKPWGKLYSFEVIGRKGEEYYVGRYNDFYEAAIDDQEELLGDVGIDGINRNLIENNLDRDQIRREMEEWYESDVRENPDIYFDESDFKLTDEQEERKEQLENYINQMEELKTQKEEQRDEYEHNSDEYNELDEQIQEIESNIEIAQEELDNIEPITEPTEDMIEDKVSRYIRSYDPVEWLKEFDSNLTDYINMRGIAEDIVDADGIEVMARYDGRYDEIMVTTSDGKRHSFNIMRMN